MIVCVHSARGAGKDSDYLGGKEGWDLDLVRVAIHSKLFQQGEQRQTRSNQAFSVNTRKGYFYSSCFIKIKFYLRIFFLYQFANYIYEFFGSF